MAVITISPAAMQSAIDELTSFIQSASPTTGQTVVMTDNRRDGTLWLTPAGTLGTLTVTLPSDANSRIGQIRRIGSSQIVTALTLNGAASILNTITALSINDTASFQKIAADTWVRIS